MQIFDAPTREKCLVRRSRTNTPLQALVTLNDVQFVEAARHLAERMLRKSTPEERIQRGYRLAIARAPRPSEMRVLLDVLQASETRFSKDAEAATALVTTGDSPHDERLEVAQHAAWTIVASMILNLDETLTRE